MKHILITPRTCDCDKDKESCPVCTWGLDICSICGAAEYELLDMPECPGNKDWRTRNERINR